MRYNYLAYIIEQVKMSELLLKNLKLMIVGHKGHGKDTVSEYLENKYGMKFVSSSWMACQLFMFDLLKDRYGYTSHEECFLDRDSKRELWFNEIVRFNTPDLGAMGKIIFETHSVYCGPRNRDEFYKLKQDQKFDYAIWVDASKRKPLESIKSMTIRETDTNTTLNNNDSEEKLPGEIDRIVHQLLIPLAIRKAQEKRQVLNDGTCYSM